MEKNWVKELEELGSFYKETRLRRGYKLLDIETENLHHTKLSRFERGETMLSARAFVLAVNAIDMTMAEFFVSKDSNQFNRLQEFGKKMGTHIMSEDIVSMKALLIPRAKKNYDKIFNILIKCAIFDISKENILTKKEQMFITEYFLNLEIWTLYDISLLGLCLEAIDIVEMYDIAQDLLYKDEFLELLSEHEMSVKKALINIYVHLICKGKLTKAENLERDLNEHLTEWDMEERIIFYVFKNILQYKREKKIELLKEIQDDIQCLRKFGATGMATRFELFLKNFILIE